ncbi:hypothetical protein [uncultured Friedmanniella sp.]|uniref:hypothetical protein n=1 Tax=uncultured Friedmanniella sp. TaxID=335381 RepID=UPI0035CB4AF7
MVLPLNMNGDQLAWVAARHALDPAVIGSFIDAAGSDPRTSVGVLGFLVAIVIGSILIALALWQSHAAAGWAAALVGFAGATHVVIGILGQSVLCADVGHVVVGAGLVVLAVGCTAVSRRLLTLSDDELDLPPAVPLSAQSSGSS